MWNALLQAQMCIRDRAYTVRLLSLSGKDTLIQLPDQITSVILSETRVYCCSQRAIYIYNRNGEYESRIDLDFQLTGVQKLSSSLLLLKSATGTYYLNIR